MMNINIRVRPREDLRATVIQASVIIDGLMYGCEWAMSWRELDTSRCPDYIWESGLDKVIRRLKEVIE